MIIKLDYREKDLIHICNYLVNTNVIYKDLKISQENLPLGDVILTDENQKELIIIERKSIKDLTASIKDGRYEEQSYRLNGINFPNHNIIYLIEGDINKFNMFKDKNTMNNNTIYSAMVSLNYYKGFSVFRSMSIEESAFIICNMAYKINKSVKEGRQCYTTIQETENKNQSILSVPILEQLNINQSISDSIIEEQPNDNPLIVEQSNYCSVIKKVKKENITPENIGEIMLCQIPGISSVTAIAIMNVFKTIPELLLKLKEDNTCLNEITYINSTSQKRKISKTAILNIIKYLQV
jgi:ERCC4-type nuclease